MIKIKDTHFLELINRAIFDLEAHPNYMHLPEKIVPQKGALIKALKTVKKTKRMSLSDVEVIYQFVDEFVFMCETNAWALLVYDDRHLEHIYMRAWIKTNFKVNTFIDLAVAGGEK